MLKRIMIMLLMAVAVIGVKAEEVATIKLADCKTSADYRAFADVNTTTNRAAWYTYADYLDVPENFTTLQNWIDVTATYAEKLELSPFTGLNGVWNLVLRNHEPKLPQYTKDAFDYLKTNNLQYIMNFYLNQRVAKELELTDEECFVAVSDIMLASVSPNYIGMQKQLQALARIQRKVDSDVVIEKYKMLYEKYYPQLAVVDSEQQASLNKVVTMIAMTLKAKGYDVTK